MKKIVSQFDADGNPINGNIVATWPTKSDALHCLKVIIKTLNWKTLTVLVYVDRVFTVDRAGVTHT